VKEVVLVSGKGGTGKTSFLAGFAHIYGRSVVMGDCDVDAANLSLFFRADDRSEEPFTAGYRARIDADMCTGCLACMEVCRFGAIELDKDDFPYVDPLSCEGCRACQVVCPPRAIEFKTNHVGRITQQETRCGPLIHARLNIAQGTSGKLVAEVRQRARTCAEDRGIELVLLDGPPGIGCPVHAALGGVDLAVAVTEPTPTGLHDLVRLLDLLDHFKIESAVLINKWDLNPPMSDAIEKTSRERGARLLGRVPFDGRVALALAQGQTPLAVDPVRRAMKRAWNEIVYTLVDAAAGGSDAA
jgi:MinD superfamily P-loop ATPase